MTTNFIYRLQQKWKYRVARNPFEKSVAEINRNQPLIFLSPTTFKIKGCELIFSRKNHSFIVERFVLFGILLNGRGKFAVKNSELLYSIDDIILRVTTAEEIFIIHEIFYERCYSVIAPWKYKIIDVGMNVGFASLFFANNPNVLKVYGYEPFRPTFDDAKLNFDLNPRLSAKIVAHNVGLGAKSEKRTSVYSANLKGKNSIRDAVAGNETIELKNAFHVLKESIDQSPSEKYFVKMDCEGAEFEIFEDLRKRPIPPQIFGFIIEWHHKDPQPIVDILISNNFRVQLRGNNEIGMITAFR